MSRSNIATDSKTVTQTATATVNVQAPGATYYAACGPSNQQSTVNGQNIVGGSAYGTISQSTQNSAYDCCVSCLNDPTCGAGAYGDGNDCYTFGNSGTCSESTAVVMLNTGGGSAYTVFDTYCGSVTY